MWNSLFKFYVFVSALGRQSSSFHILFPVIWKHFVHIRIISPYLTIYYHSLNWKTDGKVGFYGVSLLNHGNLFQMYHFIPFITSIFVERCHWKNGKKRGAVKIIPELIMRSENEWIILSYLFLLTISLQCDSESDIDDKVRLLFMSVCVCASVYLTRRGASKSDFGVYSMKGCHLCACVFVYVCRWQKMAASLVIVDYLHITGIQRETQCDRERLHLLQTCFKLSVRCRCVCCVNSTALKLFELEKKSSHLSWCLR